jgi:hypothetical protein
LGFYEKRRNQTGQNPGYPNPVPAGDLLLSILAWHLFWHFFFYFTFSIVL